MMTSTRHLSRENHWKVLFEEWKSSGKTVRNWCGERSIPLNTFRYWKDKFSPQKLDKEVFIEITEEKSLGITIRCKDFEIQIDEKFDEKTLSRCLAVMRGSLC
jgi:hypothetical protein